MFSFEVRNALIKMSQKPGAEFQMRFFADGDLQTVGKLYTPGCRYHVYTGTREECSEDPVGFAYTSDGVRNLLDALKVIENDLPHLIHDMKTHEEYEHWHASSGEIKLSFLS